MNYQYLTVIFYFISLGIYAQNIEGSVFDYNNKKPIFYCNVALIDKNDSIITGAISDTSGYFNIKNSIIDTFSVHFYALGYPSVIINNVVADNNICLDSLLIFEVPVRLHISYIDLSSREIKKRERKRYREYRKFKKQFKYEEVYIKKGLGGYLMKPILSDTINNRYKYLIDYIDFIN